MHYTAETSPGGLGKGSIQVVSQWCFQRPHIVSLLIQNVFITGGNTLHANFLERLESELCAMRPFQSSFRVKQATDPVLDAWRGGGAWANTHPAGDEGVWLTKEEYTEKGSEYMKEHTTSNQAAGL